MIKVLIIDDSALIRQLLTEILQQAKDIVVVGGAQDPYEAREMIKKYNPDVLTLDVEMPKMDGISFLKNLMRRNGYIAPSFVLSAGTSAARTRRRVRAWRMVRGGRKGVRMSNIEYQYTLSTWWRKYAVPQESFLEA